MNFDLVIDGLHTNSISQNKVKYFESSLTQGSGMKLISEGVVVYGLSFCSDQ